MPKVTNNINNNSDNSVIMKCNSCVSETKILLLISSIVVSPINQTEKAKIARLLLDKGSEISWCRKSLANSFKLKKFEKRD